ncbi:hypothetical protein DPEC_G00198660 [Dallia pectoralis]|uniref:Uncharacterized protein n=1 Tax=Dallia pectoralis TaxID=75939 RepID=A0ACC2G7X2_DALPE|nr:hypothetical protein DPEC_G00198660 [Dallia pectoralis]
MASLKANLFTVLEELILMQSWEEMDAEALEEKAAKEKLMANIWKQIGSNNLIQEDRDLWELITDYQEEEGRRMEKRPCGDTQQAVFHVLQMDVYDSTKHSINGTHMDGYVQRSVVLF